MTLRMFLIIAALVWGAMPAAADDFTLKPCKGASIDGSQVFLSAFLDGKCEGKPHVTLHVIDYVVEAICSVKAERCIALEDMDDTQRALYEKHRADREHTVERPHGCIQRMGDHVRVIMITGNGAPCTPRLNTARVYDLAFRTACIYLGEQKLGCVRFR